MCLIKCNIAHSRSVTVLCMLHKIRCIMMLPLYGALRQCLLHAVPRSHIGMLMRLLAAERRSTAGLLFISLCFCETILQTKNSAVWDWQLLRAGPLLFDRPKLLACFLFHFKIYIIWYCEAQVIELMGYKSLTPSLALPTSFNNNNNNGRHARFVLASQWVKQ